MSTPRVGSSTKSTRGSTASSFASATFCWLPPESVRHRLVDAGAANAEPLAHRFGERCLAAPADHEPARHALQVERGDVLGDRQIEEDAVALAVFAEIDDPLADRGEVVALPYLGAVAIDVAGAAVAKAADRLHRLGASRADQPAEPDDLACAHLEAEIVDDAAVGKPDHLEDGLAGGLLRRAAG